MIVMTFRFISLVLTLGSQQKLSNIYILLFTPPCVLTAARSDYRKCCKQNDVRRQFAVSRGEILSIWFITLSKVSPWICSYENEITVRVKLHFFWCWLSKSSFHSSDLPVGVMAILYELLSADHSVAVGVHAGEDWLNLLQHVQPVPVGSLALGSHHVVDGVRHL